MLPAYNVQVSIADEYIAVVDMNQYRSDMDCFVPLLDKFKEIYGFYPKYPVADAGYGSYNNYIFCKQNGMEKVYEVSDVQEGKPWIRNIRKAHLGQSIFRLVKTERCGV